MTAFPADDIERKAQGGDTAAQLELATRLEAEKSFLKARQWLWRAATAGNTEAKAALDGTPDPRTLHAGLPVATGEKWLLSQWVRYRAGM